MGRTFLDARYLNGCTRELIRDGRSEPVAFFCECADDTCYSSVWLTALGYDQLVARGEPIVAAGHVPLRLDATLVDEARQAKAQADATSSGTSSKIDVLSERT